MSEMPIIFKHSEAYWISMEVKPLFLREDGIKSRRQYELVKSKLEST